MHNERQRLAALRRFQKENKRMPSYGELADAATMQEPFVEYGILEHSGVWSGLSSEEAVSMIINGFCRQVFRELPMEFAVEAQKLLSISLEGSVG